MQAEYRRGFTECATAEWRWWCQLSWREWHRGRRTRGTPEIPMRIVLLVLEGADLRVCTEVCTVLDEAGIRIRRFAGRTFVQFQQSVPYEWEFRHRFMRGGVGDQGCFWHGCGGRKGCSA